MQIKAGTGISNLDHLKRVKAIAAKDILELYPADKFLIPAEGNYQNKVIMPAGCMLLREGAEWMEFKFRPGAGSITTKRLPNDSVENNVTISLSGDSSDHAWFERKLAAAKWVLVVEDMNGTVKLIGTDSQPLKCLSFFNSAARTWTFEFSGVTENFPYYLPGYSKGELEGDEASFSQGFDFGFES